MSRDQLILVGYDGSDAARRALDYACQLLGSDGSRLEVIVATRRSPRYGETMAEVDESLTRAERTARRWINEIEALCDERGIVARATVRPGGATAELLNALRHGKYDVVVFPRHGVRSIAALRVRLARRKANSVGAIVLVPD